jgi:hypothetical protein
MSRTRRRNFRRNDLLKDATIREFDGGWNLVDNDLNLSTSYAKVLDNVARLQDNSIGLRYGTRLFALGDDGAITSLGAVSIDIDTTSTQKVVTITHTAHGLATGDHVTFSGCTAVGGVSADALNSVHVITKTSDDAYTFRVASAATSTANDTQSVTITTNTHTVAGTIINGWYFQDFAVVVDSYGELLKVSSVGGMTRIWDDTIAAGLSGAPEAWRTSIAFASADVFAGDLIVCNGIDKPLIVNFDAAIPVTYLSDLGTGSNTNVPICRYVCATANYVIMTGDPSNPDRIYVSNYRTSGTWYGDADPNDGTYLDLGEVTPSFTQTIKGLVRFRDKVLAIFDDSICVGVLGIYNDAGDHIPDFSDTIEQHGALSHRSVQTLGNDVLMCDDVGVPSVARALFTGSIRPERASQLIDPDIQDKLLRLQVGTTEDNIFSVYNKTEGQYMLFIPNHDGTNSTDVQYNGLQSEANSGQVIVECERPHHLEVGDSFTLASATAFGGLSTGELNTTHVVTFVPNEYVIYFTSSGTATSSILGGGGSATVTPLRTETICYVYTYIPKLKIQSWARFRGWNWTCAFRSRLNRVFFGKDRRIYVYGAREDPVYGDYVGESDSSWTVATAYVAGDRVYDSVFDRVFHCVVDHTSSVSGTFDGDRTLNPNYWEEYIGNEISFDWELPWADFDERVKQKQSRYLSLDTKGEGVFSVDMYINNKRYTALGEDDPALTMQFVGGEAGGFGNSPILFGGGRRTSDEFLWAWPAHFKIAKLRFHGATNRQLKFVAITLMYLRGSIRTS